MNTTAETTTTIATIRLDTVWGGHSTILNPDPNSPDATEWAHAWKQLKFARNLAGDDFSEECPETYEVWQLLLTVAPKNPTLPVVHQFRHRCARDARDLSPQAARHEYHVRQYVNIPASAEFTSRMREAIANKRPGSIDYSIPPEGDEA